MKQFLFGGIFRFGNNMQQLARNQQIWQLMFHLLWQVCMPPSHSDSYSSVWDLLRQITTVYSIWGKFSTMTDRGASMVQRFWVHQAHETQIKTVKLGSADQLWINILLLHFLLHFQKHFLVSSLTVVTESLQPGHHFFCHLSLSTTLIGCRCIPFAEALWPALIDNASWKTENDTCEFVWWFQATCDSSTKAT